MEEVIGVPSEAGTHSFSDGIHGLDHNRVWGIAWIADNDGLLGNNSGCGDRKQARHKEQELELHLIGMMLYEQ